MDNVTHSLTAIALARAGLDRFTPRATLLLLLSANIPDADIITLVRGPLSYFESHRGYTHSFVFLPFLALVCVLLVAAVYRQKLPWAKAWLICCAGLSSHLLLDWTNTYGVRPFLPFSSRWFYLDLNSLYDWTILFVLAAGLIWPLFSRLVGSEIGERKRPGRGSAIFALLFFLLFDIGRAALHGRAVAQLESRLYEGAPPLSVAALPRAFDPFHWRGVVETASAYRVFSVDTLGLLDSESGRIFYKPAVTPALQKAQATPPFRYFRYFARFPAWSEEPVPMDMGQGKRFGLTDLRFGEPGAGSFHCIALEDAQGVVLQSRFSFSYDVGTK
ncbi:MAG TPA: metal-dependent hydrolase [Bryobacteraceae bacterium]|nr:metal-dependent hydrolase [Bryobacteraceae bacterium]